MMAEAMTFPTTILRHRMAFCDIAIYGNQSNDGMFARKHPELRKITPAASATDRGFKTIMHNIPPEGICADGAVLDADTTYLIEMRDCALVVLENRNPARHAAGEPYLVVLHVGRATARPSCTQGDCGNIIRAAVNKIAPRGSGVEDVRVYIGPTICGDHYCHDETEESMLLVKAYLDHYGGRVFSDTRRGGLSLRAVILHELTKSMGVPMESIFVSDSCTYEDRGLASLRRDGKESPYRNKMVIKTYHP